MSDGASGIASFNWYRSERRFLDPDQFHLDHYNNDKLVLSLNQLLKDYFEGWIDVRPIFL